LVSLARFAINEIFVIKTEQANLREQTTRNYEDTAHSELAIYSCKTVK